MNSARKIAMFFLMGFTIVSFTFAAGGGQSGGVSKTLDLWHVETRAPFPDIVQASADRFLKNNPDFKVNITPTGNDTYEQKLAVAMNSGFLPDIFISWSGGKMNAYVDNGLLTDLTSYMNANNFKDKFLDASIAQSSYNGKIWAVPANNVSVAMMFYNKEIFARYNLQVPNTLRELETICDTLLRNGVTPFSLANKSKWTGSIYYMYFVTRFGGLDPFADAYSGRGSFTHPAFIYAGNKVQEWVNKKYFNDGFNGLEEELGQSRQIFYAGDAAMYLMGSWAIAYIKSENPSFEDKLGLFPFPRDEAGINTADALIGTIGNNFYHIAASSPNKDKAFELITHLLDDESLPARIQNGTIPPLKNVAITDPMMRELLSKLAIAKSVQLWYDQSLSPECSEVHKTTLQEMFGLTMTPEVAGQRLQEAQQRFLSSR